MKRNYMFALLFLPILASAETLNICQGQITYKLPTDKVGEIPFSGNSSFSAMGKIYELKDGDRIYVDSSVISSDIIVTFSDGQVMLEIPGDIASKIQSEIDGTNVKITAEIPVSISVSGHCSQGQFALKATEPANLTVRNLNISNDNDAAVSLTGTGKVYMKIEGENFLSSGVDSDKPTLRIKTPAELLGPGKMTVTAKASGEKAIKSNDDLEISGGEIIASVSGNAVYDSTDSKVKSSACLASDKNLLISGGTISATASGSGGKGISVDGNLTINGGEIRVVTSGGMAVYSGSSLNHNYTGNTDRLNSDMKSSPKGIKVDGEILISGGDINVMTSGNGAEGIESKTTLTISAGNVFVQAYDDAINSSSHMYISGGNVTAIGQSNDGLDSNGNMYISGGIVRAFGSRSPECGLDANEEGGYSVVFTGGMILGVGGNNSVPSTSASTQPYLTSSISVSAGQTLTVKSGDDVLATFEIPSEYNPSSSSWRPAPPAMMGPPPGGMPPMMGPGGWGGGPGGGGPGQNGGPVLISLPQFKKSSSYTISNGTTNTTATAK